MAEYNVYKKRYSSSGILLKKGESEKKGAFVFRWRDDFGNMHSLVRKNLRDLREAELKLQSRPNYKSPDLYATLNDIIEKQFQVKNVTANTLNSYRIHYNTHIKEDIGTFRINEIKKSDILRFYKSLHNQGLSNATIRTIHAILHSVFAFAIDDGLIYMNPTQGATKDYPIDSSEKYGLTEVETQELIERVKIYDDKYNLSVLTDFMLSCGVRVSECLGLTWHDIDMDKLTIKVDHQLQRRFDHEKNGMIRYITDPVLKKAKTKTKKSTRVIPINTHIKELLVKQKEYCDSVPDICKDYDIDGYRDFVFINRNDGSPIDYQNFKNCLLAASLDNEGRDIALPRVTPHILRHTLITNLCIFGMEPKEIMMITGHKTLKTVLTIYDHVKAERLADSFEKYGDYSQNVSKNVF